MRMDGRQLNYWVAKSAGLKLSPEHLKPGIPHDPESGFWHPHTYNPANDWSQAGPIVAEEWFNIDEVLTEWFGINWTHIPAINENPLKWFMRAYVATQFGNAVEDYDHGESVAAAATSPPPTNQAGDSGLKSRILHWFRRINW